MWPVRVLLYFCLLGVSLGRELLEKEIMINGPLSCITQSCIIMQVIDEAIGFVPSLKGYNTACLHLL